MSNSIYTIQIRTLDAQMEGSFKTTVSVHMVFHRTRRPLVCSCHFGSEDTVSESTSRFLMGVFSRLGSAGVFNTLIIEIMSEIETVVTSEVFRSRLLLAGIDAPRYERSELVSFAMVSIGL